MKMNKKLYLRLVYFLSGTFVIAFMLIIVGVNFFKDSRILHPASGPKTAVHNTAVKTATTQADGDNFDTYKYERNKDAEPSKTNQKGNRATESGLPDKINVEVINRSTNKKLTEAVKSTLEAGGFVVSAGNDNNTSVSTLIIERNDTKSGTAVRNVLKTGRIIKEPDSKSRFDVTVIIGDDYNP
ncbi:MAG: LytR C-terminal domain-containing protein [Bacillota bacterium]|nr:LytR C-terminal domain-containing protein [Bacillota bacterium]